MADYSAQALASSGDLAPAGGAADDIPSQTLFGEAPVTITTYFRMRGIDTTCPAGQQPAYVYWTVEGVPDYIAAELNPLDLPCGSDPLTDVVQITIAAEWTE